MNIKSLLLGSAAVLIAASTAQAADAIIVEPEPVEYVRICDAYGSGFFYIPGTETCMNINGYIRSTYEHYTETTGGIEDDNHAGWGYRGRLNIDVRNETDWGTLRSELRLQGDGGGGGDGNVGLDRVLISVAGFRLGYSDTYFTTAHGYGAGTPAIRDGFYNFDQAIFLDYTYAADNFALTVGVQDSTGTADVIPTGFVFDPLTGGFLAATAASTNTAENLDYYIGGKYSDSWGNIAVTYIYDQNSVNAVTGAVGGDAWKASVQLNNVGDSGWNFGAWYAADGDDATQYVTGGASASGAGGSGATTAALVDYQWGVQLNGALSDNLTGYVVYTAAEAIGSSLTYIDSNEVTVGLVWRPIDGLSIQTEYYSGEADYVLAASDSDRDGFLVRITRSW